MLFINVTAIKWLAADIHIQIDCRGMTLEDCIVRTQIACDARLIGCYGVDLSRADVLLAIRTTLDGASGSSVSRTLERPDGEGWRLHLDACDEAALSKRAQHVDFRSTAIPDDMRVCRHETTVKR